MTLPDQVAALQATEISVFQLLSGQIDTRCMIDVCAHHGSTLLPFLEAGWQVHAFEPIEANRVQLLARCGKNRRLTVCRPEAVSNRTGTAAFQWP